MRTDNKPESLEGGGTKHTRRPIIAATALSIILAALISVSGIHAFLTSTDSSANSVSLAENYDIDLVEPLYNSRAQADDAVAVEVAVNSFVTVPYDAFNIQPGQSFVRDPYVENISDVDTYIFIEVSVPVLTVETTSSSGSLVSTPLFSYEINDGWSKINPADSENDGTVVYAYDSTLSAGRTTTPVFSALTFADVVDGQINGGEYAARVEVVAHGIQAATFDSAIEAWEAYVSIMGRTPKIVEQISLWEDGAEARFASSAESSSFSKVLMDGILVNDANYTVSGDTTTIIVLNNDYVSNLAEGKHVISIVSGNGVAKAHFTKKGAVPLTKSQLLQAYPIGSVYTTFGEDSPADLFGGTWEELHSTFIRANDNTSKLGSGGEDTHTLTIAEMPSHNHGLSPWAYGADIYGYYTLGTNNTVGAPNVTQSTGGSQPHNNVPAYVEAHIWKRTA